MRRGTAITLIVVFLLLVIALIAQLRQRPPASPYPGPVSGTPYPTATASPS